MPTASASIDAGEVHVWVLKFSDAESYITNLSQLLSDDEQARAVRFVSHFDKIRFSLPVVYCGNSYLLIRDTPPNQSNWSTATMADQP